MCGFSGFFLKTNANISHDQILTTMGAAIVHRGPDDGGIWFDQSQGIGFSHRRLAIIDLTEAGHQPMNSQSGRFVIAFNGEIYNHIDLRKLLEINNQSPKWRGHSDTETLLACFEAFGIKRTLELATGMFAFAVWDQQLHQLILARDRLGEKPLYYGWQGNSFLFGSELKALKAHPDFKNNISRSSISLLIKHCYIPAPYSIYEGIFKLMPGSLLCISACNTEPTIESYWSVAAAAETGLTKPFAGSLEDSVVHLEQLATESISRQMLADVPLGAFLSGGIDSSTVVALMQTLSSQPVKTFTIGFNDQGYNEATHAKAVASYLGTEHTELYVPPEQAQQVIPRLPKLYDEPFADSSQIPMFLVSQLASDHVTVSLSGDGGDELFCGYQRYGFTSNIWNKISPLPEFLRKSASRSIRSISPETWTRFAGYTPLKQKFPLFGDKLHKGAGLLGCESISHLYYNYISTTLNTTQLVRGSLDINALLTNIAEEAKYLGDIEQMMLLDTLTYLPDDILVKVDRAAMGVSLETRIPFLDHNIVEFAFTLPLDYKLRDGQTKWPLRQVLYKYVPKELIDRPKMGFAIPLADWLRGPLKTWAEQLLNKDRLDKEGYFHGDAVNKYWQEHQLGSRNWSYLLWNILMFQAWLEEYHG